MSVTAVDLCNEALSLLGHSAITALTDSTAGAQACNRWFDRCRQEALRRHPWSFAVADATLVAATEDGADVEDDEGVWAYVYALPTDFLKAACVNGDATTPYEIRGSYFYCDEEDCVLRYLVDHDTYDDWPAAFATYVATALAARIAMAITGSAEIARALQEMARVAYRSAVRDDASGSREQPPSFRDLADARF
jgi:hypothetical protein